MSASETKQYGPYDRPARVNVGLSITPREYTRLRRAARKERMPFSSWLRRLAFAELNRPNT
jgi:hypothetical protein